jgi:hypothetical protein
MLVFSSVREDCPFMGGGGRLRGVQGYHLQCTYCETKKASAQILSHLHCCFESSEVCEVFNRIFGEAPLPQSVAGAFLKIKNKVIFNLGSQTIGI